MLNPMKALLRAHQYSTRNYATVIAIWSAEQKAWSHTDGYTAIGQGTVGTEPEHLITRRDLEHWSIEPAWKNQGPFIPHAAVEVRPSVRYPALKKTLEAIPAEEITSFTLDIERLESITKSLRKFTGKGFVKIQVKTDTIHFEKDGTWALICKAKEGEP